jgi:aquaporin Z
MTDITKLLAEFIGTFVFFAVILETGQAIPIGIALIAVIYLIGPVSGGHVNPGVSLLMYKKGDIDLTTLLTYIPAQLAGAYCAYMWWSSRQKVNKV